MRRRALFLAILVGAVAAVGGAALGSGATAWRDSSATATALARAELADVPAPVALSRVRDGIARDHEVGRDLVAALAIAIALTLAGGWWLARERTARVRRSSLEAIPRTRAPPRMPAIVHC